MQSACALITEADVEEITGADVDEVIDDVFLCRYWSNTRTVAEVARLPLAPGDNGDSAFDTEMQFPGAVQLDGVGERAVWVPAVRNLTAQQGDVIVRVLLATSLGDAEQLSQMLP